MEASIENLSWVMIFRILFTFYVYAAIIVCTALTCVYFGNASWTNDTKVRLAEEKFGFIALFIGFFHLVLACFCIPLKEACSAIGFDFSINRSPDARATNDSDEQSRDIYEADLSELHGTQPPHLSADADSIGECSITGEAESRDDDDLKMDVAGPSFIQHENSLESLNSLSSISEPSCSILQDTKNEATDESFKTVSDPSCSILQDTKATDESFITLSEPSCSTLPQDIKDEATDESFKTDTVFSPIAHSSVLHDTESKAESFKCPSIASPSSIRTSFTFPDVYEKFDITSVNSFEFAHSEPENIDRKGTLCFPLHTVTRVPIPSISRQYGAMVNVSIYVKPSLTSVKSDPEPSPTSVKGDPEPSLTSEKDDPEPSATSVKGDRESSPPPEEALPEEAENTTCTVS